MYQYTTMAIFFGIVLDFILGDPHGWFHPVCVMGSLISYSENKYRKWFPKTKRGEMVAGFFLWMTVAVLSTAAAAVLLTAAWWIHPVVYCVVASIMSYQVMATKSLKDESMKVYRDLMDNDLEKARKSVSMIVGRDTEQLDAIGVAKAAVETVAENTSDGSIAPLLCLAVGGPVFAFFYKAVNTMDSMVGYKNEKYLYFGRVAAKMDDLMNFIPARIAGLLMVPAAAAGGMDGKKAWAVFWRDRLKSPSPNSAHTEAACSGALHISLLGDTSYFGVVHHKEKIGDAIRPVETEDIRRANKLLYLTVMLAVFLVLLLRCVCFFLFHSAGLLG